MVYDSKENVSSRHIRMIHTLAHRHYDCRFKLDKIPTLRKEDWTRISTPHQRAICYWHLPEMRNGFSPVERHWVYHHTPRQASCPRAVGQHKANSIFYFWVLFCFLVGGEEVVALCFVLVWFGLFCLIKFFVLILIFVSFLFLFWESEHEVEWAGSGRFAGGERIWSKCIMWENT